MADVVIERCILRVVRRGGWRWGAEPRRVVEAATRMLPALLARHLAARWPDDAEGEIKRPIHVSLSMSLAELAALGGANPESRAAIAAPGATDELEGVLAAALEAALPPLTPIRRCPAAPRADAAAEVSPPNDAQHWAGSLLRVLLSWRGRGELRALLEAFTVNALESWERDAFAAPSAGAAPAQTPAGEDLARSIFAAVAGAETPEPSPRRRNESVALRERRERLRDRLLAATEIAARFGLPAWHPTVRDAIDRVLPSPGSGSRVESAEAVAPLDANRRAAEAASPVAALTSSRPPGRERGRTESRNCRALPFLLLAPLSQLGWLDAAAAALSGPERRDELCALAAALAFKVLEPPARGWRRSEQALVTAAAFAGIDAVDQGAIARLAERATDPLSPLDALLARAVVAGHTAGQPLVVHRPRATDEALVLVDCEGLFPLGWARDAVGLVDLAAGLESEVFLVSAQAASASLFRELAARGISFVTDARPTRHEHWRPLAGPHGARFWTHDGRNAEAHLAALAQQLPPAAGEIAATWQALDELRPAAPRSPAALDHSLTVAVAIALGYLAWTLWRTREHAHPRLALERFADFDTRVTFGEETVDVHLPLGPRHSDLLHHRLLDDVATIPWLSGRTVRFTGG